MSRSLMAALVAAFLAGTHPTSEQASGCVPVWFDNGHALSRECGQSAIEAE